MDISWDCVIVGGMFAAGDVSAQMPQVAAAIAGGSLAGVAVVQSLLADDVGLPVSNGGDRVAGTR